MGAPIKVFYSWQSDTESKVNRAFIREALEEAIAGLDLEDAERPEIDQDTKGVLGSPSIAETILKKIREAKVVVADVTLTGATPEGKRLCNSNVAIELGYALGVHGDEILLKVMNTHYGPPERLPFDLAHRRWPVQYTLSPSANATERQQVRKTLAKTLRGVLEQYVAANRSPPEVFVRTPPTYNPAVYWAKGEGLATVELENGRGALQYGIVDPLIYLRIWPSEKIAPLTSAVLGDYGKSTIEPLCGGRSGWSWERNRYGLLTYAAYNESTQLASTTQVLKTGEIWGINEFLLRDRAKYPKFIPTLAYENGIRTSLNKYLTAARTYLKYPARIMIESGLVNVSEFKLAMSNHDFWGSIYNDVLVQTEVDMDKSETIDAALLKIYEEVFDAAGTPRPKNHNNFPLKSS